MLQVYQFVDEYGLAWHATDTKQLRSRARTLSYQLTAGVVEVFGGEWVLVGEVADVAHAVVFVP